MILFFPNSSKVSFYLSGEVRSSLKNFVTFCFRVRYWDTKCCKRWNVVNTNVVRTNAIVINDVRTNDIVINVIRTNDIVINVAEQIF